LHGIVRKRVIFLAEEKKGFYPPAAASKKKITTERGRKRTVSAEGTRTQSSFPENHFDETLSGEVRFR